MRREPWQWRPSPPSSAFRGPRQTAAGPTGIPAVGDPARDVPEPACGRDRQHHLEHGPADHGPYPAGGTSALQWITDAYSLCLAALLIPSGVGRPLRPPALPARGPRALRSRQPGGGDGHERRHAYLRPCPHGRRAACVMRPHSRSSTPSSRCPNVPSHRRLVGGGGHRHRDRPHARRGPARPLLLGQRFPREPPPRGLGHRGRGARRPETAEPAGRGLDVVGTIVIALSLVALVDASSKRRAGGGPHRAPCSNSASPQWVSPCSRSGSCAWRTHSSTCGLPLPGVHRLVGAITLIFFALFGSLFVLNSTCSSCTATAPSVPGCAPCPSPSPWGSSPHLGRLGPPPR